MTESKEKASQVPKSSGPVGAPKGKSLPKQWIAVFVVLIVIIGSLGVLLVMHLGGSPSAAPQPAVLSSQVGAVNQGGTYTTNITATGSFKNMTVYYGDGASASFNYNGSSSIRVSHTYANPGEYYILAVINYGSSSGYFLEPVKVNPDFPSINYAYRAMAVDATSSSQQLINNLSNIFLPNSHVILNFLPKVGGGNNQIVSQTMTLSNQTVTVSKQVAPYRYDINSKKYEPPVGSISYGGLTTGMYVLEINTTTAPVNYTQTVPATVTKTSVMSFSSGQNYASSANNMYSVNLSKVQIQFEKTNVTFGKNTTLNFTSSATLYLGSPSNVSVQASSLNSLQYKNDTGVSKTISPGQYAVLNATSVLLPTTGTNITFNLGTTAQMNLSSASAMFYGSDSAFTTLNATTLGFMTAAKNVTVKSMLEGTATIPLNNGEYDQSATLTSTYFEDFPVVPSIKQQTTTVSSFTNAEPNLPGGYTTLDPSTAFYQADTEILNSLLMPLVAYNGSSTSTFVPLVAKQLPSFSNGEINSNYVNKTVTTPWGTHYQYNVTPGENYTFQVNTNLKFMNGDPVTAWDVMYSFTRTLLFISGSPGTGGWILGQFLLPGKYYSTNSFYNITTNMTVDNATNTITLHFQQPMNPSFAFQILSADGTWVADANWYAQHGAGITWTTQGFKSYEKYGNLADYNTYVENHVMPDGPYQISYIIPGSQVTLVANPDFVSPGSWYPKANISQINILYPSNNQDAYLFLQSKQAQTAFLPATYWNQTQALAHSGALKIYGFPSLSISFYNFNLNINTKILKGIDKAANVPQYFFVNPNIRKAFSFAFNYSLYYSKQVGNEIYNTTFLSPYVGMLPPGMLYNQTEADLIASGTPVVNANGHEPFQLQQARSYVNSFFNGTNNSNMHDTAETMGVKFVGGKVQYNGNPLDIPVFIPVNDPTDAAAVATWAQDIQVILPGTVIQTLPIPLTQLFGAYAIQGQDPMAINYGAWNPDYPFPTDYLLPMAMPENGSFYMGSNSFTPYNVGNVSHGVYNFSEAASMMQELRALNNATNNVTNQSAAEQWFHVTNGMVVNSTNQVYIGQTYRYFTMSSAINGNDILKYQENVMYGGKGILLYNFLSYNATK